MHVRTLGCQTHTTTGFFVPHMATCLCPRQVEDVSKFKPGEWVRIYANEAPAEKPKQDACEPPCPARVVMTALLCSMLDLCWC